MAFSLGFTEFGMLSWFLKTLPFQVDSLPNMMFQRAGRVGRVRGGIYLSCVLTDMGEKDSEGSVKES